MGFGEAVKSFYGRYVDFQTRSSRSEYWWVILFMVIVYVVLAIPVMMSMGSMDPDVLEAGDYSGLSMISFVPLGIFALANIIPGIALAVRRLHDLDKSGWLYLIVIIGGIIPIVSFLISIGWIVVMCFRGTVGDNRFGPDPLGASMGDTFS